MGIRTAETAKARIRPVESASAHARRQGSASQGQNDRAALSLVFLPVNSIQTYRSPSRAFPRSQERGTLPLAAGRGGPLRSLCRPVPGSLRRRGTRGAEKRGYRLLRAAGIWFRFSATQHKKTGAARAPVIPNKTRRDRITIERSLDGGEHQAPKD